jgi:hypothetical protein
MRPNHVNNISIFRHFVIQYYELRQIYVEPFFSKSLMRSEAASTMRRVFDAFSEVRLWLECNNRLGKIGGHSYDIKFEKYLTIELCTK